MALVNFAVVGENIVATAINSYASYLPALAIDDNQGTYWENVGGGTVNRWWAIDLGEARVIESIRMIQTDEGRRCTQTQVEVSTDGSSWTTLTSAYTIGADETIDIGGVSSRFWRLWCLGGSVSYWKLHEAQFIGDDAPVIGPGGCAFPSVPTSAEISGWMTHIDANYVPLVQAYLDA